MSITRMLRVNRLINTFLWLRRDRQQGYTLAQSWDMAQHMRPWYKRRAPIKRYEF